MKRNCLPRVLSVLMIVMMILVFSVPAWAAGPTEEQSVVQNCPQCQMGWSFAYNHTVDGKDWTGVGDAQAIFPMLMVTGDQPFTLAEANKSFEVYVTAPGGPLYNGGGVQVKTVKIRLMRRLELESWAGTLVNQWSTQDPATYQKRTYEGTAGAAFLQLRNGGVIGPYVQVHIRGLCLLQVSKLVGKYPNGSLRWGPWNTVKSTQFMKVRFILNQLPGGTYQRVNWQ